MIMNRENLTFTIQKAVRFSCSDKFKLKQKQTIKSL